MTQSTSLCQACLIQRPIQDHTKPQPPHPCQVSTNKPPCACMRPAFPPFTLFSHGRMEGCGGLQCHGKSVPGLNISFTFSNSLLLFSSVVPTLKLFPHLRMWVRCWPPVFTAAGSIRAAIFLRNDALPKAGNHISDVRDVTNSIHAWVCVARRPRSCVGGVRDAIEVRCSTIERTD